MNVWNGCRKAVYRILFAALLPISAYVFYGALDTLEYADALAAALRGGLAPVFVLGLAALLGIFFLGLFARLAAYAERHWTPAVFMLFGVMLLLQAWMALAVRTSFRNDHLKIFDTAAALLFHETIAETHFQFYFMKYPNNIPLCLFTYVWLRAASAFGISPEHWMDLMKLVNLLFMNIGLWCAFRLICRHRSRKAGLFFLFFLFVNPLWYLLGQMYYTSTISLAFSMGAVWLCDQARRQENRRKKYARYLLVGILLAAGYKIRPTLIVTAAALLAYAALSCACGRERGRVSLSLRPVLSFAAVVVGAALALGLYGRAEARYAGFDPSITGYPTVHWIMMSAQGDGQYNSADDAYTGSFSTREERAKADIQRLKERLQKMGPGGLFTLLRNKLRVAFSDGTDDYCGLFRAMQEASPVQKYINGGRSDYLAAYLHGYHALLTGLMLLAFLWRAFWGDESFLDLLALNICGAYLFYLIWEVDRAYSIPFMLMFILWAADGLVLLEEKAGLALTGRLAPRYLWAASGAGLLLMSAGLALAVRRADRPVREYAVLQDQETSRDLALQTEFSQTFSTDKAFNRVDLWVANWDGPTNDSVYDVWIMDESGGIVAKGEVVGSAAPCMSAYTVAFEKVAPLKAQAYRIQVRLRNPDCALRVDFLYYGSGAWDMYRAGALYAPEEIKNVDLAFAVYEETGG